MTGFRGAMVAATVAVTLASFACSSNGDDDPAGDEGGGPSPTGQATSTPRASATSAPTPRASASTSPSPSPGATATAGSAPGSGSAATGEGRRALLESVARLDRESYHVVYRIETVEAGQPLGGRFVLGAKGTKNLFLMELTSSDGAFILATLNDGEKSYFCLGGDDPDNPGETLAACYEGDDDDGPAADDFPFLNFEEEIARLAADGEAEVIPVPDRRVGPFDARCWQITDDSGTGIACVAKANGFLVLVDGDFDGGRVLMEVESYTSDPGDSVFAPPYPVESFSDGGG